MDYPISFNHDSTTNTSGCDVCSNAIGEFDVVSLTVGATQDYGNDDVVDLGKTEVLFGFAWEGTEQHQGCGYNVVADADDGQCTFLFCSTDCLRRFLNGCVDHLEHQIQQSKSR